MFVSFLSTILIIVIYNKNATLKLFKVPNQNPTVFVTNAYRANMQAKIQVLSVTIHQTHVKN